MNDKTDNTAAKAKKPKAPAEESRVVVRCRVLKAGLQIAGGTAAKGRIVNVYEDNAAFHEKRGEVQILGTA